MMAQEGWPAWMYGPNGEARVFARAEEVPAGWSEAPGKLPTQPVSLMSDTFHDLDKAALERIARERFGVEIDRRWGVERIRAKLRELAEA
jgi:hypothetical protein